MIRTILNLQAVDPGFRAENVLTADVGLTATDYPTPARQNAFYGEVVARVTRLPGVVSAGFTTFLPYTALIGAAPLLVEGRPNPGDGSNRTFIRTVTPDYLRTLGVPLVSGRGFSERDTGAPAVGLVSERLRVLFDGDPIGQRVSFGGSDAWLTVVGVVGDIHGEGIEAPNTRGIIYMPTTQSTTIGFFSPRSLAIRTVADPLALVDAVRREIWSFDSAHGVRWYDSGMTASKIAITLPREQLVRVRRAVRRGQASSVSAYIAQALAQQDREESLAVLLDDLVAQHGAPTAEDRQWARRVLRRRPRG